MKYFCSMLTEVQLALEQHRPLKQQGLRELTLCVAESPYIIYSWSFLSVVPHHGFSLPQIL